jgi:IS605 OrfB family transposase
VPLPATGHETGIDVGLKVLRIAADGAPIDNPRHSRRAERALRTAQRRVARRTKGSRRRRTAVALLTRTQQQVQRQRRDYHHTTALDLLQQYDVIYLEDLQVRNMVRNRHLAKRISDAGWAAFRAILTSTAAYAGTWVIAMPACPPAYTSQDCSGVLPDGSRCPQQAAGSQKPVDPHPCPLSVLCVGWCSTATRTRRSPFCGPGRPVRRERGRVRRALPEQPPA